jgi:branched-chain amino acid transport system permease protein
MSAFYAGHEIYFQTTAIYFILALSFQTVLKTGVFSFASVGFFGIGGYLGGKLAMHGVSEIPVALIVFVACGLMGFLLSLPFVRLRGLYLGMVTIAFDQIMLVVANNGGSLTGGPTGLYGIPNRVTTLELFLIALVTVVVVSQLERRHLGRLFEAIRADENLAKTMGYQVFKNRNFIFSLSAALGGLAGALEAFNLSSFGTTSFGFSLVITGLTMAVVGGIDSWRGAAIGTIFVVWFPAVATSINGNWQAIIYGSLIIVTVTLEPSGIYGVVRRVIRFIQSSWKRSPNTSADAT